MVPAALLGATALAFLAIGANAAAVIAATIAFTLALVDNVAIRKERRQLELQRTQEIAKTNGHKAGHHTVVTRDD
jgi:hypothetical protein